jgi:hypothetical protein
VDMWPRVAAPVWKCGSRTWPPLMGRAVLAFGREWIARRDDSVDDEVRVAR